MNLVLALFWLALGLMFFARQAILGDPNWYVPVGGHRLSCGWFMLVLVVYNLTRWWSVRVARLRRRELDTLRQRETRPDNTRTPSEPPNPEFDFTDKRPEQTQADAMKLPAPPS